MAQLFTPFFYEKKRALFEQPGA